MTSAALRIKLYLVLALLASCGRNDKPAENGVAETTSSPVNTPSSAESQVAPLFDPVPVAGGFQGIDSTSLAVPDTLPYGAVLAHYQRLEDPKPPGTTAYTDFFMRGLPNGKPVRIARFLNKPLDVLWDLKNARVYVVTVNGIFFLNYKISKPLVRISDDLPRDLDFRISWVDSVTGRFRIAYARSGSDEAFNNKYEALKKDPDSRTEDEGVPILACISELDLQGHWSTIKEIASKDGADYSPGLKVLDPFIHKRDGTTTASLLKECSCWGQFKDDPGPLQDSITFVQLLAKSKLDFPEPYEGMVRYDLNVNYTLLVSAFNLNSYGSENGDCYLSGPVYLMDNRSEILTPMPIEANDRVTDTPEYLLVNDVLFEKATAKTLVQLPGATDVVIVRK